VKNGLEDRPCCSWDAVTSLDIDKEQIDGPPHA